LAKSIAPLSKKDDAIEEKKDGEALTALKKRFG
jgi:hypothetical protein